MNLSSNPPYNVNSHGTRASTIPPAMIEPNCPAVMAQLLASK